MINTSQISLPLGRYRFNLIAETDIHLPAYSGSAWRGLFGHALKRTVCVTHEKDCKKCLLWRSCVYSYVFETPPPVSTKVMRKYTAAPHPFVISPDPNQREELEAGDLLHFDFVLIGKANQHLPYIIHAIQQSGMQGIGKQRGKFSLQSVAQETTLSFMAEEQWQTIYSGGELLGLPASMPDIPPLPTGTKEIELSFTTPFRFVQQGQLIRADAFQFYHLLSSLMRRLSMLSYFHTDTPLDIDFKGLTKHAKSVGLQSDSLHWYHWKRYSSRQQTLINMGGLVGSIKLDAAVVAPFWEMLVIGQFVNAGKITVMGLGKYELSLR